MRLLAPLGALLLPAASAQSFYLLADVYNGSGCAGAPQGRYYGSDAEMAAAKAGPGSSPTCYAVPATTVVGSGSSAMPLPDSIYAVALCLPQSGVVGKPATRIYSSPTCTGTPLVSAVTSADKCYALPSGLWMKEAGCVTDLANVPSDYERFELSALVGAASRPCSLLALPLLLLRMLCSNGRP